MSSFWWSGLVLVFWIGWLFFFVLFWFWVCVFNFKLSSDLEFCLSGYYMSFGYELGLFLSDGSSSSCVQFDGLTLFFVCRW